MLELYFVDHGKRTLSRFAKTDYLAGLLDILQLVLDSRTSGLDNVVIMDPARPGRAASAARIATHYGMRRRSFDEKLANVKTYDQEAVNNA